MTQLLVHLKSRLLFAVIAAFLVPSFSQRQNLFGDKVKQNFLTLYLLLEQINGANSARRQMTQALFQAVLSEIHPHFRNCPHFRNLLRDLYF